MTTSRSLWFPWIHGTCFLILVQVCWSYVERTTTVGGLVTLPCTVRFSGSPQVMWQSPQGEPLTMNERVMTGDKRFSIDHPYQSEWNLQLDGAKSSDGGNYTCVISATPVQRQTANLIIVAAPTMVTSSDDVEIPTGSDVTLHCEAQGSPAPIMSWYRFTYVGHRELVQRDSGDFVLTNVTRQDGATYECEADNGVPPTAKALIRVDVMFSPLVDLPHQFISQEEFRDTFLQCSVTSNPPGHVTWLHDGQEVEDSEKYRITSQETGHYNRSVLLVVHSLTTGDFGTYTCIAENDLGSDQADMMLKEWQSGHVRIVAPPQDVITNQGLDVVINCTVEQMNRKDSVAWWHYDRSHGYVRIYESHPAVTSDTRRDPVYLNADKYSILGHYNLLVRDVQLYDGGEYVCELVGRRNHSAYITVVDQIHCGQTNNISIIDEGSLANLACGMQFSGPIRLWNSVWRRENLTMSSIDEDRGEFIRRSVSFPVNTGDTGIYVCVISNQDPPFYSQCETPLHVIGRDPAPSPVCNSGPFKIATSDMAIIMVASIGGMALLFTLIIVMVCCHYKKRLRTIRSPSPSPEKTNGDVNLETSRLTSTDANEHEV